MCNSFDLATTVHQLVVGKEKRDDCSLFHCHYTNIGGATQHYIAQPTLANFNIERIQSVTTAINLDKARNQICSSCHLLKKSMLLTSITVGASFVNGRNVCLDNWAGVRVASTQVPED